jgi:hypothetical protein
MVLYGVCSFYQEECKTNDDDEKACLSFSSTCSKALAIGIGTAVPLINVVNVDVVNTTANVQAAGTKG